MFLAILLGIAGLALIFDASLYLKNDLGWDCWAPPMVSGLALAAAAVLVGGGWA